VLDLQGAERSKRKGTTFRLEGGSRSYSWDGLKSPRGLAVPGRDSKSTRYAEREFFVEEEEVK